jgi:hypothetical protein
MPYIEKKARQVLDPYIDDLINALDRDIYPEEGEINYVFTRILNSFYKDKYSKCNTAMGILECVKAEYYRRRVAPYEDKKKKENGEVYV